MSCFICRRGNCIPCFHSIDEQIAFSKAEEAYDRFCSIWEECRDNWLNNEEEESNDN